MKNMQLQVCSRQEAESLPGRPDWAVISITDPVSVFGPAKLKPGWLAVHRVNFQDADPSIDDPELTIMMSREDARGIIEFVRQYAHRVEGFMVHCNEGISRSQGVAAWIADAHNLPVFALHPGVSDTDFALDPRFNKYVYELLKTESTK
jgi:predicted protein tyrosine phosphatase